MAFGSIWKFGADNSEYKKAVREMPSEMDKSARQIESRTKEMGSKMSGAMREFTGILAGGAMVASLNKLLNQFGRIDDLAIRFGTNAESIQRVGHAAQLAGTDIEAVANAMTKAGIAATTAAREGGKAAETFGRAGISARSFADADLAQKVVMIAEAYAKAGGNADKTAAIIEIMGARAGANLIPLISNLEELRERMSGVAVASSEMTKRLAEAGDMLDKWKNQLTIAAVGGIQVFTDSMERLGSILAQGDGLFRLVDGLAKATRGNIIPLFEVLGTSRTIAEMEQIELRAQAIAQLTREGLLTGSDSQNSALIAERMEQIRRTLEGTKTVITDINDDLDKTLAVEKEKTAELERQQRALESQEASRQKALRSVEQEVALIEARLRGDKAGEARLLEDADFQSALERTGSFEAASNFAATRAAERRAKGGPSAGTAGALEADRAPTDNERVGALRGDFRAREAEQRAAALQDRNMFRSSIAAENRAQRRRDRAMESARLRDTFEETYGASNFGEAFREYQKETPFGQRLTEDQFKKFHEDMAKTPEQRAREEAQRQKQGGAGDQKKDPASAMDDILKLLKKHVPNIDEKLPQHALV